MARAFVLPDLGEGLTEAEIVKVLVQEGDLVREDAPLLEVETDKATVEIPSPVAGRVTKIHVQPGQTVKVGAVLVTFEEQGGRGQVPSLETTLARDLPPAAPAVGATQRSPAAAPATRRRARGPRVDLRTVRGTGPGGRVTDDDVRAASAGGRQPAVPRTAAERPASAPSAVAKPLAPVGVEPPALPRFEQWGPVERQPLSHLRRTIAERMTLSATLVPHVTHFDRADITELAALAQRVREGKATLEDLRGGTFTLTNIGALGGTGAVPIINYPEVAILGVARAREEPVVLEGRIVPRVLLPLSLTFDHRVADGADGARFAAAIVRRLERPEQILLEW